MASGREKTKLGKTKSGKVKPENTKPEKTMPEDTDNDFKGHYKSGEFADFVIKCEGREWKVHRVIISSRSGYFRKACQEAFREGMDKCINLEEEDPYMVEKMLLSLYTLDDQESQQIHPKEHQKTPASKSMDTSKVVHRVPRIDPCQELLTNAEMYAMGDKYDIPRLRQLSMARFSHLLEIVAKDWNRCDLEVLPQVIECVFQTTVCSDRGLRDPLVPVLKTHWLHIQDSLPEVVDYLKRNGEAALELLNCDKVSTSYCECCRIDSDESDLQWLARFCYECGKTCTSTRLFEKLNDVLRREVHGGVPRC